MHAAPYELQLQHGAAPGRAGDSDLHRLRAELGMTGNKSLVAAEQNGSVAVVLSLDLKDGGGRKILEGNASLDFRLDDAAIHFIAQVRVRHEHRFGPGGSAWGGSSNGVYSNLGEGGGTNEPRLKFGASGGTAVGGSAIRNPK